MPLALNTREVGKVTIIQCSGRIVAGKETESLHTHLNWLLRDRKNIVLHLGDVVFIDSSGLGTMVRMLTSTRRVHGDLKLCNAPDAIHKVLGMTRLTTLFDAHESEENAVAAFYQRKAPAQPAPAGRPVLCVDPSADVLAYLREVLRREGYEVHTTSSLRDALILIRVVRPDLLLVSSDLAALPAAQQSFQTLCGAVPVIDLGKDFCTLEAGTALSELLEKISACLLPQNKLPA
jgi:anti-sigma B factor antagonist